MRWLRALARLERGAGAEKRPRFAGNEGSAAREAAFRIEPSRVSFSRPAPRASTPNAQPEPSARGRQAMAEIRESGKPFDYLAFCGAIQRMLKVSENRPKLFAFSEKLHQNVA